MVRINLLPHRQIKRAERQRQFGLMAAATVVLACILVFMVQTFISARIDAQNSRNSRLDEAIVKLDKQIAEIKELKNQIQDVLERKQVVENLQSNRSQAVIVLDELARQIPEGIYLKSIKQKGNLITLEGNADANARIATLVRNLSSSGFMEAPGLIEIKALMVNNQKQNNFILNVSLKSQKPVEDDKKSQKTAGKKS